MQFINFMLHAAGSFKLKFLIQIHTRIIKNIKY